MKLHWAFFLLLLLMTSITFAQEDEKSDSAAKEKTQQTEEEAEEEKTIAEQFRAIRNSHQRAVRRNRSEMRRAKRTERVEILEAFEEELKEIETSVLALVEQSDEPAEKVDLLIWIDQNGSDESSEKARNELLTNHLDSEKISGLIQSLFRSPSAESEEVLRTIIAKSPHDSVKAAATMGLSNMLGSLKRLEGMDDSSRERVAEMIGEDFIAKWTPEAIAKESDLLLESLVENYSDVPVAGSRNNETYGDMVEGMVFAKNHLQIGSTVEDIVANDLDGEEFKLSDYRGKVVVLDFWGDW